MNQPLLRGTLSPLSTLISGVSEVWGHRDKLNLNPEILPLINCVTLDKILNFSPPQHTSETRSPASVRRSRRVRSCLGSMEAPTPCQNSVCQEFITNAFYNRLYNKILKTVAASSKHSININNAFRDGTYGGNGGAGG